MRSWFEKSKSAEQLSEDVWETFIQRIEYYQLDATSHEEMRALCDEHLNQAQRDLVIYLATPPQIFAPICTAMENTDLVRPNTRIVVEKPLGDSPQRNCRRPVCVGLFRRQYSVSMWWLDKKMAEGLGIVEVLFGDYNFSGKLGFSWPRNAEQIPIHVGDQDYDPLYEYGFGLTYQGVRISKAPSDNYLYITYISII